MLREPPNEIRTLEKVKLLCLSKNPRNDNLLRFTLVAVENTFINFHAADTNGLFSFYLHRSGRLKFLILQSKAIVPYDQP